MPCDLFSSCLLAAAAPPEPWLPLWAMELLARVLLGAWLFYFGACVGSFLNVVVYRLPRGLNLVYPGSRCPVCGHAIRVRDNLPIVSWLALGGRCRDCRTPISPRYYYVELIVGLVFLLVAVFAAFLPYSSAAPNGELGRRLLWPQDGAAFWAAYALHVGLAATLLGATLIEYDGFRVPRRLFAPLVAAALALGAIWPRIRPLALGANLQVPDWQAGLPDGLAGLTAGLTLGAIVAAGWRLGTVRRSWPQSAPSALLAATGCVLGWQPLIELAPLAAVTYVIGVAATSRAGVIVPLAAAVLAWALPRACGFDVAPVSVRDLQDTTGLAIVAATAVSVAILAALAGRLAGPQYSSASTTSPEPSAALPDEPLAAGPPDSTSSPPS